uniref:Callitachykinin-1 n=1 Tax=Calliphora vomitoria TaxID=27454 RepID=TKC1_CALVO|nr:RecName: Full=Callitachykinin-1; AltName: Full=Callitachykinin I [Calliphora vomitoria]
APTAFYGVR